MHDERGERATFHSLPKRQPLQPPRMFLLIKLRNTIWARAVEGGPRHPENGNLSRDVRNSSESFLNLKRRGNPSMATEGPSSISGVGLGRKIYKRL